MSQSRPATVLASRPPDHNRRPPRLPPAPSLSSSTPRDGNRDQSWHHRTHVLLSRQLRSLPISIDHWDHRSRPPPSVSTHLLPPRLSFLPGLPAVFSWFTAAVAIPPNYCFWPPAHPIATRRPPRSLPVRSPSLSTPPNDYPGQS